MSWPSWPAVGLLLVLSAGWCCSWRLGVARAADSAEPPAAHSPFFPGKLSAPTPDQFRRRFDEVQRELVRLGAVSQFVPAAKRRGELLVLLEYPTLLAVNTGEGSRKRAFAVRLLLLNQTSNPVTLSGPGIQLQVDNQRVSQLDWRTRAGYVVGEKVIPASQLKPVEQLTVPAGQVRATRLVFGPLKAGRTLPRMTLLLDCKPRPVEVDVNRFFQASLKLTVHRLGPRSCLAVLQIAGELNVVNVRELERRLSELQRSGTRRAVVWWTPSALPVSPGVVRLLTRPPEPPEPVFVSRQFGPLGAPLDVDVEVFFAGLKTRAPSRRISSARRPLTLAAACRQSSDQFAEPEEAVVAALWDVYQRLPRAELLRRLQHALVRSNRSHPEPAEPNRRPDAQTPNWQDWELAAALVGGAESLPAAAEPLVLQATRHPAVVVRRAAAAALRQFASPRSVQRLAELATKDPAVRADAVESLAAHRSDSGRDRLLELLRQRRLKPTVELVQLLVSHPDPRWSEVLRAWVEQSEDEQLAAESLKALASLGHPQVNQLLGQALTGPREQLRHTAFQLLAQRGDPRWRSLLVEFVLEQLKKAPPTPYMLTLLAEAQEKRAVPLLERAVERGEGNVESVLYTLAALGDAEVAEWLNEQYPRLKDKATKAAALRVLHRLDSPHFWTRAQEALQSKDAVLFQTATTELQRDGTERAVALLEAALAKTTEYALFSTVCNTLAQLATPPARRVLLKTLVEQDDERLRSVAATAFEEACARSPAAALVRRAESFSQKQDWQAALDCYEVADQIDPNLPDVLRGRAHCELLLDRVEEAYDHFKKALELVPHDGVALAGLAVAAVRLGRVDEGVRLVESQGERFKDDALFQYNAACAYARAVEQLQRQNGPDARKRRTELEQKALRCLKRAFELGFDDRQWARVDPDLVPLHDSSEFQRLVLGKES